MLVVGFFSHYFLLLVDRAYGWGVLPSIDGYFISIVLWWCLQGQLEELRQKMGAQLSERYMSQQKGTAKMMSDYDKLRRDLLKVSQRHDMQN